MHYTDVVVVGAGPVGLFAVFQAGSLSMKCHVIDNLSSIGGQCSALYPEKPIYDIPAFSKVSGQELIDNLALQAAPFNPVYHLNQVVTNIELVDNDFIVHTSSDIKIHCKAVVIAAGNGCFLPNKPNNLDNLAEFEDKSVFYNVNSKQIFANKNIVIAGGGDSAVDWAIELSNIASKVYLVHRRKDLRCLPASQVKIDELCKIGKIETIIPYQLHKLNGAGGSLESVELTDFDHNIKTVEADFLLAFFGLAMKLGPIQNWSLNLSDNHKIIVDSNYQTNIEGIYAVGDIATYPHKLKLILVGFSEVAYAMHHAYKKVFNGKELHFQYSTSKGIHSGS